MSALIQDKLITPCGAITNPTAGGYIDAAGNIVGSPGFLPNMVVDVAGNLGTISSAIQCLLSGGSAAISPVTHIGVLNYPGTTHVDTWTSDMQVISTNRSPSAAATIGAIDGYSIVYAGAMSGSQSLTVAGTNRWLGEYFGGGTVIMTGTSTINGPGTVDATATLQMGLDPTATTGTTAQAFTVNGTLNQYGAYAPIRNVIGAGNTVNTGGVVNIEGPDQCGLGMISSQWTSVAAGGTWNVTNAWSTVSNTGMNGTFNINEGASVLWGPSYSGTVNLNSPRGWKNAACVEQPNLLVPGGGTFTGKLNIGPLGGEVGSTGGSTYSFNPTLSGSGPLQIGPTTNSSGVILQGNGTAYTGDVTIYSAQVQPSGNALVNSKVILSAGTTLLPSGSAVTIKSLQTTAPTDTTARLLISSTPITITNQDPEPYYGTIQGIGSSLTVQAGNLQLASTTSPGTDPLILQGSAKTGGTSATAKYGGPLTVSTSAGGLSLVTKPSNLIVTAFNAPNNFTVDIGAAYAASPGTYTILTTNNTGTGINKIPSVGINDSGLTPTFAWVSGQLRMTLA